MKCKTLVLAAGLSLASVSAFADDFAPTFDLSPISSTATVTLFTNADVNSATDAISYFSDTGHAADVAKDLDSATDNTALISQMGTGNVAYIEQHGGAGNFALIAQDGTTNPNGAYILQGNAADDDTAHNYAAILQSGATNQNNAAIYQIGTLNTATIYQH
jgi:hypothetical protein